MKTKAAIKKAGAGRQPAGPYRLRHGAYREPIPLSSTKNKLLVEIRGLLGSLGNPFLSQGEKETSQILFRSTIRKLNVLQNGYCSGCGCVESKNAEQCE